MSLPTRGDDGVLRSRSSRLTINCDVILKTSRKPKLCIVRCFWYSMYCMWYFSTIPVTLWFISQSAGKDNNVHVSYLVDPFFEKRAKYDTIRIFKNHPSQIHHRNDLNHHEKNATSSPSNHSYISKYLSSSYIQHTHMVGSTRMKSKTNMNNMTKGPRLHTISFIFLFFKQFFA